MRLLLSALPPYAGGKRRLLGQIFKHLPKPTEAPVFVDAFLGGGAVSLRAKARGYRVVCNDLAERSVIVGRALIENDRVTLSEADALRLFVSHLAAEGFVQKNFAPDVLTRKHAEFLVKTSGAKLFLGAISRIFFVGRAIACSHCPLPHPH